jgi:hypothetical protein
MDTEDITNGVSLLEEALESAVINIKQKKIRTDKIIEIATKKFNKYQVNSRVAENDQQYQTSKQFYVHPNMYQQISSQSGGGTTTSELVNDSITVTQGMLPSEIYVVYKTDSVHSQSSNAHCNLAYSGKSEKCANSDTERIIDMRVKQKE